MSKRPFTPCPRSDHRHLGQHQCSSWDDVSKAQTDMLLAGIEARAKEKNTWIMLLLQRVSDVLTECIQAFDVRADANIIAEASYNAKQVKQAVWETLKALDK